MGIPNAVKVWDPAVRLFHWLLVAGFFFTYVAEGEWLIYHLWVGYGVFALLCFRLVWGVVGSRFARFGDFVYGPGKVLRYLRAVLTLRAERHLGHNPAGGAMILALLACLLLTVWSGVLLYGADARLGPAAWLMQNATDDGVTALEALHGSAANLTVLLVVLHVAGVVWQSLLHRENLVKAMITGRKSIGTEGRDRRASAGAGSPDGVRVPGYDVWIEPEALRSVDIGRSETGKSLVRMALQGERAPRSYSFDSRQQALAFYRAVWALCSVDTDTNTDSGQALSG